MDSSLINPLDFQMQVLVPKINNHSYLLTEVSKHIRIRINAWVSRLESIISNNIWRKNRNNYLRLLYIMLQCREIMQPFTSMAPQQLPTLQKHQINCILLKLSTRIKQKQRQKQNKDFKVQKINPVEMWSSLDSQCKNTKIVPIPKPNTKSIYHNQSHNYKNSYLQSIGIDLMSPVSQIPHNRGQSNLSECTYKSIEKVRDMITPKQKIVISHHVSALKQRSANILKKPVNIQEGVKYFKKNREIKKVDNKQQEEFEAMDKKTFFIKIFCFLKRHQENLEEDIEYTEVMTQLSSVISGQSQQKSISSKKSFYSAKTVEKQHQYINYNYEEEGQEHQQEEAEQSQNSFDYKSGNYSQYSSIQIDEGIQNLKINESSSQQCFRKKIFCQNLCNKLQSMINPSGKNQQVIISQKNIKGSLKKLQSF